MPIHVQLHYYVLQGISSGATHRCDEILGLDGLTENDEHDGPVGHNNVIQLLQLLIKMEKKMEKTTH